MSEEQEAITVAELVRQLQALPQNYTVYLNAAGTMVVGITGAEDIGGDYFGQVFLKNFDCDAETDQASAALSHLEERGMSELSVKDKAFLRKVLAAYSESVCYEDGPLPNTSYTSGGYYVANLIYSILVEKDSSIIPDFLQENVSNNANKQKDCVMDLEHPNLTKPTLEITLSMMEKWYYEPNATFIDRSNYFNEVVKRLREATINTPYLR